jgi:hypothetical protein
MMKRSDLQRYPLTFMLQDALVLLAPIFLIPIGAWILG